MTEKKKWFQEFLVKPYYYARDDGVVLCGHARSAMADFPDESVSLIFTDPDYSKGSNLGYWTLAQKSPRILIPGGVLITEVPHRYMTGIMMIFQLDGAAQGLLWRWLYAFLYLKGAQRRLRMGIRVIIKPMLCYVKGKWKNRGFVMDGFPVEPQPKVKHKWQKNLDGYKYFIERHTSPGDIVLDPFAGSGTTAFACRELGRRFVLIDCYHKVCADIAKELKS